MDKEVLAVIGSLYLENLALRNALENLKNQPAPQKQDTKIKEND